MPIKSLYLPQSKIHKHIMKIKGLVVLTLIAALITSCNTKSSVTSTKVKTVDDSLAYALGIANYTFYTENFQLEIDPVLMAKGMLDAKDKKNTLNDMEARMFLDNYMHRLQVDRMKKEYQSNIDASEKFLAENKKREGVMETTSGLQYEVITMGTGEKPGPEDQVRVHYTGTLVDGTEFDSSVSRGEPSEFYVGQVIQGWQEGLQLMPVGSKFKFFIPYELAYGEEGRSTIPPFSTLIFDVELLGIVK